MKRIHGRYSGISDPEVFEDKLRSLGNWWSKFGGKPNMHNRRVLEIGSARGALSVDAALSGAAYVLGVDTDPRLVDWANQNLVEHYPQLEHVVRFCCTEVPYLDEPPFEYAVSRNAFEHIYDLGHLLREVGKRLKARGVLYASFGPLWRGPFGDHRRFHRAMEKYNGIEIPQVFLPWMHLVIPESILKRVLIHLNKRRGGCLDTDIELYAGLNKMSLAAYLQAFRSSGLRVELLQINALGQRRAKRAFSVAERIPLFKEVFADSITVILCKEAPLDHAPPTS